MRRLALAIAFACVLSGAMVRAGEIHTTGAVATPTPSSMGESGGGRSSCVPGETPGTDATASEVSSTASTIILTLIDIVY